MCEETGVDVGLSVASIYNMMHDTDGKGKNKSLSLWRADAGVCSLLQKKIWNFLYDFVHFEHQPEVGMDAVSLSIYSSSEQNQC